jgi:hypothetical protein
VLVDAAVGEHLGVALSPREWLPSDYAFCGDDPRSLWSHLRHWAWAAPQFAGCLGHAPGLR